MSAFKLRFTSIRQKAIAMFVSFTTAFSLLYLGLALVAAFIVEDVLINRVMNLEQAQIQHHFEQTGEIKQPSMPFIELYSSEAELPEAFKTGLVDSDDHEVFTATDEHFHFSHIALNDDKRIFMIAEVSPLLVVTTQPAIFEIFLFGFVISLLLAVYVASRLASSTVSPILQLAEAVNNKKDFDGTQHLPDLEYETGYLSRTLQSVFMRLDEAFDREKNFTADVSHELRTPLAILKNSLMLIEKRGFKTEDLVQLETTSSQMTNTLSILLMLARNESLTREEINLRMALEQSAMLCSAAEQSNFHLDIDVDEKVVVTANPQLLELLFINLINNAISHSKNACLNIALIDNQLLFSNSSEPIVASDDLTESGIRSPQSQGIGHGLNLVVRIIALFKWQYRIDSADDQFKITLFLK